MDVSQRKTAALVLEGLGDAPDGHVAWSKVRYDATSDRYVVKGLLHKKVEFTFQVGVKGSGSKEAAAQIARLCYVKHCDGKLKNKESVVAFRDECVEKIKGLPPGEFKAHRLRTQDGPAKAKATTPKKNTGEGSRKRKMHEDTALLDKKTPPKRAKTTNASSTKLVKCVSEKEWMKKGLSEKEAIKEADELFSQQYTLCTVLETRPLREVRHTTQAKALVDGIKLNNDVIMPVVGFGTYKLKKGEAFVPVFKALEVGYRLIDTAQIYDNEMDVGRALRQSGIPRDRVCIETKHWRSSHGFERTLKACRQSLRRLGVDYIDVYLIHWPGCKTGWPLPRGTKSPPDWTPKMRDTGTWRAMEQMYDEGKVRALGVSNYSIRHIKSLLKVCRVRPTVNQVEFHPWLVQSELLEFCKKEGIVLQAYASIGSGDVSSRADFFAMPPVAAAAKAHDRTPAQILLRWAMEKGVHVIPKSKSVDRMVENFGVFDFKLTAAEVAAIDAEHKGHRFAWKHLDPDTVL
jgi:diketogulonate reductase-like aldo/keto reductase